jgi:hypothetical protein
VKDESASFLSLRVIGPDEQVYSLDEAPPDATAREICEAIMPPLPTRRRYVVDYMDGEDPEGIVTRLDPEATLIASGVRSGGTLRVRPEVRVGGGLYPEAFIELAAFLGTAVASGVAGNAAYDLLKRQMAAGRGLRYRRLRKREAVQVARACLCIKRGIESDKATLVSVSRCRFSNLYGKPPKTRVWAVEFDIGADDDARRTVFVYLDRSDPDAEAIKTYAFRW